MSKEKLLTVEGRLTFCKNLFNPNEKGRLTLAVVFDKDQATIEGNGKDGKEKRAGLAEIKEYINGLVADKWGANPPAGLKSAVKTEEREEMLEKYPFMKDRYVMNLSNGNPIEVGELNSKGEWASLEEGEIKAGDYVQLSISGYTYDNATKGVGLNAHAVLKTRDGEAFYSRQTGASMFGLTSAPKTEGQEAGFDNFGF